MPLRTHVAHSVHGHAVVHASYSDTDSCDRSLFSEGLLQEKRAASSFVCHGSGASVGISSPARSRMGLGSSCARRRGGDDEDGDHEAAARRWARLVRAATRREARDRETADVGLRSWPGLALRVKRLAARRLHWHLLGEHLKVYRARLRQLADDGGGPDPRAGRGYSRASSAYRRA